MASKVLKISAHSSISTEYCLTLRNNNHCKQCSLKCVQGDTSETRISLSTPHFLGACGTWADKPQPNKHLLERKWFTTQIYNKYQHFATITSKYLWELYECCCLFKTWCPNLWVGDVDSCSVVAFFADVEAASWIRICSACVVFSCVLQSVCSVFNVQCVGWFPICSAPPTASTHRAGSVWQEGADLNTMPPGYSPPTPPVQTAPDQDLNALLTPTPSTIVSYSCLGCSNALLRIAQNAKLKEYIVIIKGVANSDLLSDSFPNFTGVRTKSFFVLFVIVISFVLYIFGNI